MLTIGCGKRQPLMGILKLDYRELVRLKWLRQEDEKEALCSISYHSRALLTLVRALGTASGRPG